MEQETRGPPGRSTEKPRYVKPAVIATYTDEQLKEEFSTAYGQTHVDLFFTSCPPGPWPPEGPCPPYRPS